MSHDETKWPFTFHWHFTAFWRNIVKCASPVWPPRPDESWVCCMGFSWPRSNTMQAKKQKKKQSMQLFRYCSHCVRRIWSNPHQTYQWSSVWPSLARGNCNLEPEFEPGPITVGSWQCNLPSHTGFTASEVIKISLGLKPMPIFEHIVLKYDRRHFAVLTKCS